MNKTDLQLKYDLEVSSWRAAEAAVAAARAAPGVTEVVDNVRVTVS